MPSQFPMRRWAGSKVDPRAETFERDVTAADDHGVQDSSRCPTASIRAWTFFSTAMRPM